MASFLDFKESDTESEYLPETGEYESDSETDLSICDEEDDAMEQKGQYTYVTPVETLLFQGTFRWLATLTAVPLGLGSNPGEDTDVCKCIVPSQHGGTLNSRRAASPLVRLVEGEERREAPDHPRVFSLKIGVKPS
ncbi:uncharacterized protein TNCV_3997871 [Trichonephila clavipes]|nr:uncharacterized protein TNCV_3997871 [Trichonephila clavipes]